ncbi:MAG: hypothetical protein EXS36_05435 [Pedosphaera sp.]|nr:hypothetical protein [Pedosphaera sp.]
MICSGLRAASVGRSFAGSALFDFDADGACGPNHYAEITNRGLRVISLASGAEVYNVPLWDFWRSKVGTPSRFSGFDPHIEYDHSCERWFATSLTKAYSTDSAVLLGVSDGTDPSGSWKGFVIDADPEDHFWADYPQLGIDGAAIYIRMQMIGIESSISRATTLITVPKSDLTSSVPTVDRLSRFSVPRPIFPDQPSPTDLNPDLWPQIDFLGTSWDGLLVGYPSIGWKSELSNGRVVYQWAAFCDYQRVVDSGTASATISSWSTALKYVFQQTTLIPPPGPWPSDAGFQMGTEHRLGNNGGNNYVRVGNVLYSVGNAVVQGRVGIAYTKLCVSSNSIIDSGFIGDELHDHFEASIGANPRGDVVIAYLRTGASEYASLYASFGRADVNGHLKFGSPILLKAGTDIFDEKGPRYGDTGPARLSDYSTAVSIHPADHSRFWVSGPYVSSRNAASTWIAELVTEELPILSVGRIGVSNEDVEIRFNSVAGKTYRFQRSATLSDWHTLQSGIAGTGAEIILFDPGQGLFRRLFWRLLLN